VAATPRPGAFNDRGIVSAREAGAPYNPANHGNNVPRPPTDARDLPSHPRFGAPNTGNPKLDQKYQQEQQKLYARQEQDHQKLQQRQERDHQQLVRNADENRRQQVEQRHQQQTQHLEEKHVQQSQHLENREQSHQSSPGREHH
jgi:hypothetical protein